MLSFGVEMKTDLKLPPEFAGAVWHHDLALRPYEAPRKYHTHDELEVNLVRRGTARYLIRGRSFELRADTLIWLFPEQEHVLVDFSADYIHWVVLFKPSLVTQLCTADHAKVLTNPDPPEYFARRLEHQAARKLHGLFEELVKCDDDPPRFNAGLGYSLLSAWQAFRSTQDSFEGLDIHPAVEKAARLLRDGGDDLGLEALAKQAGLSPKRLGRLFKKQTGVPLTMYRNRLRLRRFLDAYGSGQRVNMLEAALTSGFGSYPQFHRIFRELVGCSPAEYKRRQETERD